MAKAHIGKMRNRVTVQERSTARDNYGHLADDWKDVSHQWAMIEPVSAREFEQQSQQAGTVTHRISLRHVTPIGPTFRVVDDGSGRVFNVVRAFNPDERRDRIEIEALEVV